MTEEDFDFSVYGEEEDDNEIDFSKKSKLSFLRSRFNDSLRFIEMIADLREQYTTYSLQIRLGTRDINMYRKHYATLDTALSHLKVMIGTIMEDKIEKTKVLYQKLISQNYGKIHERLNEVAFKFEEDINLIALRTNISLDVEKIQKGNKSRELIVN